jgi:P-type Mg2+ transporter
MRSADAAATPAAYWSLAPEELFRQLRSGRDGLTSTDAGARLRACGPNAIQEYQRLSRLRTLGGQLRSPLLLLLVFAAAASALTGEWVDAGVVLVIVATSVAIGYSREYSARAVVAALRAQVRVRATVLRDRRPQNLPVEDVVPGDVVLLSAGSLIPADGVIVDAADLFVSEAVLTGESFPVPKQPGTARVDAPLPDRTNSVFMGTNVRSGTARYVVVETGSATEYGRIAGRLTLRPPETEFDRGIRRFGYLLTSAMLLMVLLVFAAHMLRGRPPVETLLFAVALAVGLSPELLPAILSVNLARSARVMASQGVLVRRLNAIENLGSMDVLCTDKTGTLTQGVVELDGAFDGDGAPSEEVLHLAVCNAAFETGVTSALDEAILRVQAAPKDGIRKVAEIPFDFLRKRVTVVVRSGTAVRLITKGAFQHVLEVCTRSADGTALDSARITALERRYQHWSRQGIRVLAVADTEVGPQQAYGRDDEQGLRFAGFVTFLDRPKADVADALTGLAALGVSVKLITGDNRFVAQHVAAAVGLPSQRMLTGAELDDLHDEALWHAAEHTNLFVEVDPNQKERIILSLKKMGHVVGFLGDGVNDAPAMHAADTSLSVEQAVDVAREAADFVLLRPSLSVIRRGIEEGRRTFANTLKYVLITTSANLGNMVSMAAASLFLPFLPLTAGQILLNNILSDVPAIGLADDNVDPELVAEPRRWDLRFLGRFMLVFGAVSSIFDVLTFGVLQRLFRADPATFRTGWFVESLLTELVIALVVRTRRPFFRSRPGFILLLATAALVPLTVALPFTPVAGVLGFVALPPVLLLVIAAITLLYVAATELVKRRFYRFGDHSGR